VDGGDSTGVQEADAQRPARRSRSADPGPTFPPTDVGLYSRSRTCHAAAEAVAGDRHGAPQRIRRATCLSVWCLLALGLAPEWQPGAHAQAVPDRSIGDREAGGLRVEMREVYRVGSLNGANDSFGRVMSAALSRDGHLFVADDIKHSVVEFDSLGHYVRDLATRGHGPGEVERPWLVATDPLDSVYVFDPEQARVSIFAPDRRFARSFRVPISWMITSIDFELDGSIVVASFGGAEAHGVHVLRRDGSVAQSLVEVDRSESLAGFESSLLGGSLDVLGRQLVYSRKSPYELLFYSDGRLISTCRGSPSLTTRPADVVEFIPGQGTGLHWERYSHSASVVFIDSGLVINVIMDPARDRRVVDLVTSGCQLIRRTLLPAPLTIVDRVGNRLAAVSNVEFPEVVVYEARVVRER
jgi:hypothetical protein